MAEIDPNGRDQHQPGQKLDANKNRLGLVHRDFSLAIEQVGRVATFGAKKYTPSGWVGVPEAVERYTDALYRHLNAHDRGELVDQDSGLSHLGHACWNALALCELSERSK